MAKEKGVKIKKVDKEKDAKIDKKDKWKECRAYSNKKIATASQKNY